MVIKPGRSSNLRVDLWNNIENDMKVKDRKYYEKMRMKSHSSKVSLTSAKLLPIKKGIEFFVNHASDNSRYILLSNALSNVFNFTNVIIGEERLTTDGMNIGCRILYSRKNNYKLDFSSIIKFKNKDSKILYLNIPPTLTSLADINNTDQFFKELVTRIYAEFYYLERKVSLYNSVELFYTLLENVSFLFHDKPEKLTDVIDRMGIDKYYFTDNLDKLLQDFTKYTATEFLFPELYTLTGPLDPVRLYQTMIVGKTNYVNKFIDDIVNGSFSDINNELSEAAIYDFEYEFPLFDNDISSFIYQLDLVPLYLYTEIYGAKLYRGNIYNRFRRQLNMSYSRFAGSVMYLSSNKRKVVSQLEELKKFINNRYETMIENILYDDDEVRNVIRSFYNYLK